MLIIEKKPSFYMVGAVFSKYSLSKLVSAVYKKIIHLIITMLIVFYSCFSVAAEVDELQKEEVILSTLAEYAFIGSVLEELMVEVQTNKDPLFDRQAAVEMMMRNEKFATPPVDLQMYNSAFNSLSALTTINTIYQDLKIPTGTQLNFDMYETKVQSLGDLGLGLNVVGLLGDSYSFVQNFRKAVDNEGNVYQNIEGGLAASQNVLSATQNVVAIANVIATSSSPTATRLLASNIFSSGMSQGIKSGAVALSGKGWAKVLSGKLLAKVSFVTTLAQIEGIIYQRFRDGEINKIKGNLFGVHQAAVAGRKRILSSLLDLYFEKEMAGEPITQSDIVLILGNYPVFTPNYATIYHNTSYHLSGQFTGFANDISKLETYHQVSSYDELNNDNRVLLAVEALASMASMEDDELDSYLRTTIEGTAFSAANVIFGAFGSSIYDIHDSTSLRETMFPYLSTSFSSHAYYKTLYKIFFNSHVASVIQFKMADLGRELERLRKARNIEAIEKIKDERREAFLSSLLKIENPTIGQKYTITFDKNTPYRDEIFDAKSYDDAYRLFIEIDGELAPFLEATYDETTGQLVFESPTDKPLKIHTISIRLAPWWSGDMVRRASSYSLVDSEANVSVSVNTSPTQEQRADCPEYASETACIIGIHEVGSVYTGGGRNIKLAGQYAYMLGGGGLQIVDVSIPTQPILTGSVLFQAGYTKEFAISGNYAYVASYDGLRVIDISSPQNPILIKHIDTIRTNGVVTSGNYAFVAAYTSGLIIFDITDASNPIQVGELDTGTSYGIAILDSFVYLSNEDDNLKIIDISIPSLPIQRADVWIGTDRDLKIHGNTLYVEGSNAALFLYDLSDPTSPTKKDFFTRGNTNVAESNGKIYVPGGGFGLNVYAEDDLSLVGSDSSQVVASVAISGGYAYLGGNNLRVLDISNPVTQFSINSTNMLTPKVVVKNTAYTIGRSTSSGYTAFGILDVSDPINIKVKSSVYEGNHETHFVDIAATEKFAYVTRIANYYNSQENNHICIYDVENTSNPTIVGTLDFPDVQIKKLVIKGNYLYVVSQTGLTIFDISVGHDPINVSNIDIPGAANIFISGNHAYVLTHSSMTVIDISNSSNPIIKSSLIQSYLGNNSAKIIGFGDYVYIVSKQDGLKVINVAIPSKPELVAQLDNISGFDVDIENNYLYIADYNIGMKIVDISNPSEPILLGSIGSRYHRGINIKVVNGYAFVNGGHSESGTIIDVNKAISYLNLKRTYNSENLILLNEDPKGVTLQNFDGFMKSWTFNKDITDYGVSIVSNNNYWSINPSSFTLDGQTLSVHLNPNDQGLESELKIELISPIGKPVLINGKYTLDVFSRQNTLPRLADNQPSQMVSPTSVEQTINTFDANGDSVSLSIVDADNGSVTFAGNQLKASFADTNTHHQITIGLNDGKETVQKTIDIYRLDSNSIGNFYNDVQPDVNGYDFESIALATLQGIASGQSDPRNSEQRIFRPTDDASMAETLIMLIKAAVKADKLDMPTHSFYLDAYPSWSIPYYSLARDLGAVDDLGGDLSILYPTREQLAQILVKLLDLEDKLAAFPNLDINFDDSNDFSHDAYRRYGQIVKLFGLFMTEDNALPQQKISRSDITEVVKKIFMMPTADISISPEVIEMGQTFTLALTNIKANTQSSTDYSLQDNSSDVLASFAINRSVLSPVDIDTQELLIGDNELLVLIESAGVKNVLVQTFEIKVIDVDEDGVFDHIDNCPTIANADQFNSDGVNDGGDACDTDDDNDGVVDAEDAFPLDSTESVDIDGDGIGNNADTDDDGDSVLDVEDAFPLDATESVDTDLDGIGNNADADDDGDSVLDADDAFPLDATESVDTDGDGIGNNADTDDDNDGIIDEDDSAPLDGSIGDDESPVFSALVDVVFEATGTNTALELVVPEVTDNNLNAPSVVSDYSDALPLGTHEITWTATDFVGNVSTAKQQVTIVDTTNPQFDELQIQTIDAMGVLSDISGAINNVQAYDLVDGNINAVVIGDTIYPSGAHFVPVSATDNSGNIVETDVEVHINPLVELSQSRKVEPGATVLLPVTLSGNAAVYPVEVTYTLMQSGSIIETNELLIAEDISGVITIAIPNDALDGDVYAVEITSASNAALGFVTSTQLTVDEANFAPTLTLVTQQGDKNISVVDTTKGVVTVTAIVNDINVNDIHDIVWSSLNDTLVDLNTDGVASTFEFTAEGLTTDTYELTVSVSESNTSELFSVIVDIDIVVDASLEALDENSDSDNDGISDADEGYSDSDNDGISDYLDTDDNPSRLPIDDSTAAMQTVNGLNLSLGDVVKTSSGATASDATVDINDIISDEHFTALSNITNFNVSGLTEVGQSVPIVIPLANGNTIAEGSIYRKYSEAKGWFDFVVNSENGIYSALADEDGNCPYPLSIQYQEGLAVGDNCIQLIIKDGGENDADGLANGMVKDPGVLTSEVINQAPVIVVNSNETANEGSAVTFDAATTTDAENDTLTYQWVQLTGVTVELSGQDTETLSFTAPQVSSDEFLTFELTVNDGRESSTAQVDLLVLQVNIAPTVSIDSHTPSFDEGDSVSLKATGADEDADALSYSWEQISGPTVTLSGASSASVTFTAPTVTSDQSLELKVTVSDGIDAVSKTTTVTINNVAAVTPPVTPPKESGEGGGSMGWILIVMSFGLLRKRLIKVAA